jgi:hypothetical protein
MTGGTRTSSTPRSGASSRSTPWGGEFQFGYVHGWLDCRLTARYGASAVEWTWDGNDEMARV